MGLNVAQRYNTQMPDKYGTLWELKPHTAAKHTILRSYLGAWFPKLASVHRRLVFVDGFAGPGEYVDGEPGSPIVALRVAMDHKADLSKNELVFLFVEADDQRYANLLQRVSELDLPEHIKVQIENGEFADKFTEILDEVDAKGRGLAPALVMADPFGFKGLPMEMLVRITKHERSELLISFMYESVARFRNVLPDAFDELFGCPDWRKADALQSPTEKRQFLHDLYVSQLKQAGMKFVRSFQMLDDGNRTEYFLIFASKHIEGLKAMKRAMWNADPSGKYRFSDATNPNQATLFKAEPDWDQVEALIKERFGGSKDIPVSAIEYFVVAETPFLETHYKKGLAKIERAGGLYDISGRNRNGTYPPGTRISFR